MTTGRKPKLDAEFFVHESEEALTPQSTVDAICHSARCRGIAALQEPDNKERLARCDEAAMKQIRERIETMREKGLLSP